MREECGTGAEKNAEETEQRRDSRKQLRAEEGGIEETGVCASWTRDMGSQHCLRLTVDLP
jgi:hypothetical protein